VVPLCAPEPRSPAAAALIASDPEVTVWWGTRVECVSAMRRRAREGRLGGDHERRAFERLSRLAGLWTEVAPSEVVRRSAERLVQRHVLTAADVLQLAAALEWAGEDAAGAALVTFDERLARAASGEGFTVLPG
jgi:predicted nucleic acid-binding protein